MFIIVTWNSWIESLISQTWLAFDFNSPISLSSCVTLSCKLFTWLCASAILFKEKQRKGQRLGLRLWDCDGRKLYLWKTHMTDWHRRKMSYLTEVYTVYTNLLSLLFTSPNEEEEGGGITGNYLCWGRWFTVTDLFLELGVLALQLFQSGFQFGTLQHQNNLL